MGSEEWLAVCAVLLSLAGLIGLVLAEKIQEPVSSTIEGLSTVPEGSKVVFRAQIEKWKPLKEEDRLELSDGNQLTAMVSKGMALDWNQGGVFEFVGILEQKPKRLVRILQAKRID